MSTPSKGRSEPGNRACWKTQHDARSALLRDISLTKWNLSSSVRLGASTQGLGRFVPCFDCPTLPAIGRVAQDRCSWRFCLTCPVVHLRTQNASNDPPSLLELALNTSRIEKRRRKTCQYERQFTKKTAAFASDEPIVLLEHDLLYIDRGPMDEEADPPRCIVPRCGEPDGTSRSLAIHEYGSPPSTSRHHSTQRSSREAFRPRPASFERCESAPGGCVMARRILVRHGQSIWNMQNRFTCRATPGRGSRRYRGASLEPDRSAWNEEPFSYAV